MGMKQQKLVWVPAAWLALAVLTASSGLCIAQDAAAGPDRPPAPDILDSSSSSSSSGSSPSMTCTHNIKDLGTLPVADSWDEANDVITDKQGLQNGGCVGYKISAANLAKTPCAMPSADSYILVEFWQLRANGSSSSSSSSSVSTASVPDPAASDANYVRIFAAKGVQPWINVGADGHAKITPPVRDPDTGVAPVGTFQDDDAIVYSRPVSRMFLTTSSAVVDLGEPLDPKSWYITIANLPQGKPLSSYAIRASCIVPGSSGSSSPSSRTGSSSSSKAAAAAADVGVPCPVPVPGGKQCSGRGSCRADFMAQTIEHASYCNCDPGFGSWGCQRSLQPLPINAANPIVVTVGPGQWSYFEVTLPAPRSSVTSGPRSGVTGSGTSGDQGFAAAAAGLGPGLLGNEALLVTAERIDVDKGFGGNPLIFLKPFMTKDHNEPSLDALDNDLLQYSDLRSFQLQLNKHYIFTRLPLQDIRSSSTGSSTSITYTMPRRWYVAVFNSNARRTSEPAKVQLQVQYRDLNRQQIVCPFNCSGVGKCVDPLASAMGSSWPFRDGVLSPMPIVGLASGGRNGADAASISTAIGPMQTVSPVDAGFQCVCDAGFGGLTCEGRLQTLTVGSGEQKLGPETLNPGNWFFYLVTVDQGFNPQNQNLGIQWMVGVPGSNPGNYTNAFISFDQGPMPRQVIGDQRLIVPVRKPMTPYTKLVNNNEPPLPLQVPGGQLNPGGSYVVSVYNNDYFMREPFQYTLGFFVMSESPSFLHPYMSILLGVTAAVILCLAMTLCKRLVMRYGLLPWRWRQRRRQLAAAAAGGDNANGNNSLALVLMAQQQQQQSNRGVPREIYEKFPCRPFAAKDYQQRQQNLAQQQQQQDVAAVPDQGANAGSNPADQAVQGNSGLGNRLPAGSAIRSVLNGLSGVLIHRSAAPQQQQQQHAVQPAVQLLAVPQPSAGTAAAAAADNDTTLVIKADTAAVTDGTAPDCEVHGTADQVHPSKDDELPSCTVCLCEYVPEEMVRQLPCGHEFHQGCIDQWMANHGTCPICRAPLWPGAFEPESTDSDGESDTDQNNPAAIYVHHDMPSGGFRGNRRRNPLRLITNPLTAAVTNQPGRVSNQESSVSNGGDGVSNRLGVSNPGQRISMDSVGGAAAAGAGVGGVTSTSAAAAAAAPSPHSMMWYGVNNQQLQRLLWQQQQQQSLALVSAVDRPHQQQQQQRYPPVPEPAAAAAVVELPDAWPAAAADTRRREASRQQQQQQGSSSGPDAV